MLIKITDEPNWETLRKSVKIERLETFCRKWQNKMQLQKMHVGDK